MPMQHWAHSIQSAFGTHNSTLAVIVTRRLAARLGQWSCFRFAMCVAGVGGNASWQETARAHFRGMLFPKIKAFLRRQLGPTRFYVALSSRFQEAAPEEDSGEKAWLAKMLLGPSKCCRVQILDWSWSEVWVWVFNQTVDGFLEC